MRRKGKVCEVRKDVMRKACCQSFCGVQGYSDRGVNGAVATYTVCAQLKLFVFFFLFPFLFLSLCSVVLYAHDFSCSVHILPTFFCSVHAVI